MKSPSFIYILLCQQCLKMKSTSSKKETAESMGLVYGFLVTKLAGMASKHSSGANLVIILKLYRKWQETALSIS